MPDAATPVAAAPGPAATATPGTAPTTAPGTAPTTAPGAPTLDAPAPPPPEPSGRTPAPSGPVIPTASAIAAQHPLPASGVRLTGGLLHDWTRRNVTASMPLALHQLVVAGNLDNLQLAIRAAEEPAENETQAGTGPAHRASGVIPPASLG